ncbi:hypothetical protein DNH61_10400 [Paenibacillus sambharensis]|uniref:YmcC n=1 Tax=Paenibacillus sambharensis TaxID=1803190 RepID=A0A2W1LLL7_9BACL|nr:hypothetical protein [Paenibacillus sambharensis]PZD95852.1 hypothetical protein DNH61_10400 [Paenibacillus sambharensis]
MSFIAWIIVACEVAFWVVIILGLLARYVFKLDKAGLFLLYLTPVIDLILLIITGVDLYRGAAATTAHAVAAVYIGVSIAFGKSMIQWADVRFKHYVLKEDSLPAKRYGIDYARHYLKGWFRHVLAYLIGAGLLALLVFTIQDPARTEALVNVWRIWTVVLGIDLIITITYFIWPRQAKA